MSEKFTLELDDEAFTLASGVFPDGAVWLKVTIHYRLLLV